MIKLKMGVLFLSAVSVFLLLAPVGTVRTLRADPPWRTGPAGPRLKTKSVTTYRFVEEKNPDTGALRSRRVMDSKLVTDYNESGWPIDWTKYDANENIVWQWKYQYNDKGQKIESRYFSAQTLLWKYDYQYNENSCLVERILFQRDGKVKTRCTYSYSLAVPVHRDTANYTGLYFVPQSGTEQPPYTDQRLTEALRADSRGKTRSKTAYDYDKRGRLINETNYDADRKLLNNWHYSYDDNYANGTSTHPTGRLDWAAYIDAGKLLFERHYKYNRAGQLISITSQNPDGDLIGKWVYQYHEGSLARIPPSGPDETPGYSTQPELPAGQAGLLTEQAWYNENDKLVERSMMRYHERNLKPIDRLNYVVKKIAGESKEILATQEVFENEYQ